MNENSDRRRDALRLRTERLELVAATLEMARANGNDPAELAHLLTAALPSEWPPPLNDRESAQWLIERLSHEPSAVGWLMWFFVREDAESRIVIGNGGFKGRPVLGTIEVGYSIVPEFQRKGYASEAVGALLEWAFFQAPVVRVIAETLPDLVPSQRLLRKLGFRAAGAGSEAGIIRFELSKEELQQDRAHE
ncbi:MAG: GNAT family N-acetyltransferase [Candidatus Eremiobacteraeota bacterium]|nr:GNAT family N-acetyltransferase [Candidatus Eremiobacteraeota bacterium]